MGTLNLLAIHQGKTAMLSFSPLNQLRQSQLVLRHIFYPSDLLSLSWPPFTSLWKEMQIFLRCNGQGEHSAVCRILFFFFFSFCPRWQLHAVGHSRSLPGSNGIARRLYPDLPLRSLSCFSNPLISELTSTHCPPSCYDSHFNLVDGKGQHSQRGWSDCTETLDITAVVA